jgi:hypothetical protein
VEWDCDDAAERAEGCCGEWDWEAEEAEELVEEEEGDMVGVADWWIRLDLINYM